MNMTFKSIFLMSKYAIPQMEKRGEENIIDVSSGWELKGGGDAISYFAYKGAVTNETPAMAIDHGAQKIRINAVCPCVTDTPLLRSEGVRLEIAYDQLLKDSSKEQPLVRIGNPMYIAQAVLFHASDSYIHYRINS